MSARYLVGDVRDVLATLPDSSVDLIFTSPPFLALRSYLPADHPDKQREIGSEPDPGAFIDTLLGITEDLARVLAPHGSLCVELGDTYASGGAGFRPVKASPDERSHRNMGEGVVALGGGPGWPEAKSACLIPELYRLSLAYGRNPLTGRETPRWRVRNTIRWCRPNPPVGSLGDKFRPATSEIVVACKARDRYFDLDAVRSEVSEWTQRYAERPVPLSKRSSDSRLDTMGAGTRASGAANVEKPVNQQGAPPLDWWKLPTHGYPGAHYATFPPALVTIPLLSMCPERVCTTCGLPSRRITESDRRGYDPDRPEPYSKAMQEHGQRIGFGTRTTGCETVVTTVGWSSCGHDTWRPGLVLDPFGGSGTVAEVATGNGRDAILIDIDSRNADLARERVGMFLTVELPEPEAVA